MPIHKRAYLLACSLLVCHAATIVAPVAALADDAAGASFNYRFELGERGYCDVVTLANGEKVSGKVLEWANEILVFNAAANPRKFPLREVESIDLRRNERHNAPFAKPDLTVAYVERLPRDPSWHGHVTSTNGLPSLNVDPNAASLQPKTGESVIFRIHILNAGGADSAAVPCRASVDGKPLGEVATIQPLKPGGEQVVEVKWPWQEGQHELKIEIDSEAKAPDALRWNNTFTQPTRGLAVTFAVARDRYEAFKTTPNMVDSYCFEDYAQYHVRALSALFAASVYPSAPKGAEERIYCDRIVVVDDALDAAKENTWLPALHEGGKLEGLALYAALVRFGKLAPDAAPIRETGLVNWTALQDVGRQLGLGDLKKIETTVEQCYVFDITERFAMLQYLSPYRASLMHTPGGFPLTEEQVGYLNQSIGRPRGVTGDYHYQLPAKISLKILANNGLPLRDVQVDVFQLMADGPDAGRIIGIGRSDPIFSTVSNENGIAELANLDAPSHKTPGGYELTKNPFGKIAADGSNGLLLLRLRSPTANEEFNFLPLTDCNVAYLRGQKSEYNHSIPTRFSTPAATVPPPPFAAIEMWDRKPEKPVLQLTWVIPKDVDPKNIEEFRVYRRTGFAGQQAKPWTLVSVHKPPAPRNFPHGREDYFTEFQYDGPYSLDTFFAVSSVDTSGQESNLSQPGYVTYQKEALRFAVHGNQAFMTARGTGQSQMLFWDGRAGTQPHQMKLDNVKGYKPAFEGIAFAPDGRLVVTDPENHVLAIYDPRQSELLEVLPKRETWPGQPGEKPGEFNSPADIAIDLAGNMYVADRNNHRVQILGPHGESKGLLDPDFRFRNPTAVAFSIGHIAVTDKGRTRCRIYDISKSEPKLEVELPPLVDADRAIVNAKGRIFITGRLIKDSDWTMLSFDSDGQGSAFYADGAGTQGEMGTYEMPRSIYQHNLNPLYIYMVCNFPFDVRRLHIEQ